GASGGVQISVQFPSRSSLTMAPPGLPSTSVHATGSGPMTGGVTPPETVATRQPSAPVSQAVRLAQSENSGAGGTTVVSFVQLSLGQFVGPVTVFVSSSPTGASSARTTE